MILGETARSLSSLTPRGTADTASALETRAMTTTEKGLKRIVVTEWRMSKVEQIKFGRLQRTCFKVFIEG